MKSQNRWDASISSGRDQGQSLKTGHLAPMEPEEGRPSMILNHPQEVDEWRGNS